MSLKKLGRYELVRVLGTGAMGIVYEGRDPNLDRRVAIKTVKVENLSEEAAAEYEARFRTEARSAARLQHPNIVSVYDSDRDGDIAFLVMEFIQGEDLKHHLDRGVRYSLEQSLKMIRDLLSALDYAHKQGIVHRDIKPANLLLEPSGRVKLTDFGVARIQDSGEATRTQGSMVGTLKYMSPEQVQGQKIDSRADLFSVGVVLYQLLTDKRPFDGDNDFSIIHQIIGHTPSPPTAFNAKLPSAIDAVVARALAKHRDERFATARDFAAALQAAIRRAEDQTVVPPADPARKPADAGGTGSKAGSRAGSRASGPLTSGTSGSSATVTQELELVYWKDIKDSSDPEELEGFLEKFPEGIYADLARRRLRRLRGLPPSDATMPPRSGMGAGGEPDDDATRMRGDLSQPRGVVPTGTAAVPAGLATGLQGPAVVAGPVVPAPTAAVALPVAEDATRTLVVPREAVPVPPSAAPVVPPLHAPAAAPLVAPVAGTSVAPIAAPSITPIAAPPIAPMAAPSVTPARGDDGPSSAFPDTRPVPHEPTLTPTVAPDAAAAPRESPEYPAFTGPQGTRPSPRANAVPRDRGSRAGKPEGEGGRSRRGEQAPAPSVPPAAPAPAAPKKLSPALLGMGALAVGCVVVLGLAVSRSRAPAADAAAAASAPLAVASAPAEAASGAAAPAEVASGVALVAQTASAAASGASGPVAAASAMQRAASGASAPRPAVAASRPQRRASQPASAPATPTSSLTPTPLDRDDQPVNRPATPTPAPATATTPGPRPVPPMEACKDLNFIARLFCLQTECAKPANFNAPVCVKMREEARLREESRVRN